MLEGNLDPWCGGHEGRWGAKAARLRRAVGYDYSIRVTPPAGHILSARCGHSCTCLTRETPPGLAALWMGQQSL